MNGRSQCTGLACVKRVKVLLRVVVLPGRPALRSQVAAFSQRMILQSSAALGSGAFPVTVERLKHVAFAFRRADTLNQVEHTPPIHKKVLDILPGISGGVARVMVSGSG